MTMRPILLSLLFVAAPAWASSPAADAAAERASARACVQASGLKGASVGPVMRFSDAFLMDARTVTGTWPQPHMKGRQATMLCLYNRRTRRAETQELTTAEAPTPPAGVAGVKDVWWQVSELDGRKPVGRKPITMMLGSDGKVGGNSGCNGYSANYMLTGLALKVYPPMIGTRMACAPAVMAQENRYRAILERAQQINRGPAGSLIVTADDGRAIRFVPAPKG
jgi:heat shock protein HslJ